MIKTAQIAGLSHIPNGSGAIYLTRDNYDSRIETGSIVIVLRQEQLAQIAQNFKLFFLVAETARKYLEEKMKIWEESRDVLSTFVLQEKITT